MMNNMIKNGSTRIRNAGIAEVFGRMYVIEGWGTGIKRMIESCREYGLPDPAFTEIGTNFRVEFFRKTFSVKTNLTENCTVKLTEKQEQIIELIREDPTVRTETMAQKIGCSRTTISTAIKELKEMGKNRTHWFG